MKYKRKYHKGKWQRVPDTEGYGWIAPVIIIVLIIILCLMTAAG